MESEIGRTIAAEQDRRNEEIARSGTGSQLIDNPLKVNADDSDNLASQPPAWKTQVNPDDSPSPPQKPLKRSTTLSVNKEAAIDKDRDARRAKAESKYLAKCDRLEQTAQGSNMPETLRRERQDKLDDEYHRKLEKIDKRYHRKLERAERKVEKENTKQAKQESKSSSNASSSLNSPRVASAPSTPLNQPKKNKVKSFLKDLPSSTGDARTGRHNTSSFNPGVGGGAMPMFGGAVGGTSGCDGGGCAGGDGGGGCVAGTGGC